jgi:hypothetical protein
VSAIGPLDDLIAPGVYRHDGRWVGLRIVGEAYVFATSSDRQTLVELLASAVVSWRKKVQAPDAAELTGEVIPHAPQGRPTWLAWAVDRWPTLGPYTT